MATASKTKPVKKSKSAPAAKKTSPSNPALNPYLSFNGNCEAAFKFYQKVFGVEAGDICRYKDMPPSDFKVDAKLRNKIMHMSMQIGSMTLMGADACPTQPATVGNNIALSVCVSDTTEAKRIFKALSARGKVTMKLEKTFWAELFGMVTDRFGISWMVNYQGNV